MDGVLVSFIINSDSDIIGNPYNCFTSVSKETDNIDSDEVLIGVFRP
jgi:hypothetical protein